MPSWFSTINPCFRIRTGTSNFRPPGLKASAGVNSATKSASSAGRSAMKFTSIVKLASLRWQVAQVRPFPLNCSLRKRLAPFWTRSLKTTSSLTKMSSASAVRAPNREAQRRSTTIPGWDAKSLAINSFVLRSAV